MTFLIPFLVAALAAGGAEAAPEQEAPDETADEPEDVTTAACPYVAGGAFVVREGKGPCISMYCLYPVTMTLGPLVIRGSSPSQPGESLPKRATCTPGRAVLSDDHGAELVLRFVGGAFSIDPVLEAELARLAKHRPGAQGAIERLTALARALSWVPELAGARGADVSLLVAREEIARQRFDRAETILVSQGDREPQHLASRRAALRSELAEARRRTAPLRAAEVWRIGRLVSTEATWPPHANPAIFWRGSELCAVQGDEPATMRCYDPDAKRWSGRQPTARPDTGVELRYLGNACLYQEWWVLPGYDGGDCGQFRQPPAAVIPGPTAISVEQGSLVLSRPDGSGGPLEPARATELVMAGPGSRLLGGARYVVTSPAPSGGVRYAPIEEAERTWMLIERPPGADQPVFSGEAVASPDQRFVLAMIDATGRERCCVEELWLVRVKPARASR